MGNVDDLGVDPSPAAETNHPNALAQGGKRVTGGGGAVEYRCHFDVGKLCCGLVG